MVSIMIPSLVVVSRSVVTGLFIYFLVMMATLWMAMVAVQHVRSKIIIAVQQQVQVSAHIMEAHQYL